jgi:manganese/zinc/iron transport system permease protein
MHSVMAQVWLAPNLLWVLLGTAALAAISAIIGTFTYLQKKSLLSDAVAHGMLPGIAGAFLLYGQKDALVLSIGAFVWGIISIFSIQWISRKTILQPTSAMAIVLSVYFGLGMVLLSRVQQGGYQDASGLQSFLFGQAASIVPSDLMVYGIFGGIALLILAASYRQIKWISFDVASAQAKGVKIGLFENILSILVVVGTAIGMQSIGLILIAALLITPAAIARMWTNRVPSMMILAAIIAIISAVSGSVISFSDAKMPTGPWIVLSMAIILILSAVFSPRQQMIRKRRNRKPKLQSHE